MRVGWIGLGKLGLPCALAAERFGGHEVVGYDTSDRPARIMAGEAAAPQEEGIGDLISQSSLKIVDSPLAVVHHADLIFIAVQTPHAPEYGGDRPAPGQRRDFEYAYLVQAVRDVCRAAAEYGNYVTVVVVSTVLPGTTDRLLRPLLNDKVTLLYCPAFIAMGTTVADYRDPEFVICGAGSWDGTGILREYFEEIHGDQRMVVTSYATAETVKICYNVFISAKIVFANMVMEICHKTGADCDEVTAALARGKDRIISPRYLSGGMGDGGACHPRDLIALSWLAQRLDLSYDLPSQLAAAREDQTRWLADLARSYCGQSGLPLVILGKAYKPGSDLTDGSPALLLARYLADLEPVHSDVRVDHELAAALSHLSDPAVFVIATRHPEYPSIIFPPRSVVIDPFGYIPDQAGVTVVRVGRK